VIHSSDKRVRSIDAIVATRGELTFVDFVRTCNHILLYSERVQVGYICTQISQRSVTQEINANQGRSYTLFRIVDLFRSAD
jgi:hypothetical protein